MNRRTPVLATAAAVLVSLVGIAPAHATTPDITSLDASPSTIYPLVATAAHPGATTLSITGDANTVTDLQIRNGADVTVRDIATGGASAVSWNGRDDSNTVVPAGTYTVYAIGDGGTDASPSTATVTVSGAKLVLKSFSRTVSAASSTTGKFVGKCSTLRKPSKRGWRGSLGYYSNTKCASRSFAKAGVLTINSVTVPAAERYLDIRVNMYGGAAKAARKSRGVLLYLDKTADNAAGTVKVTRKLGNHTGRTVAATPLIPSNRRFTWSFAAAAPKAKYDVKSFTVVLRYYVLG